MELRRYGSILWRYWWLVLLFTLAGGIAAYTNYKSTSANYQSSFQANIQHNLPSPTQPNTGYQDYYDYYRSLSAEYVLDDYTMVAKGSVFLTDVAALLKDTKYPMSVDDLKGAFDVERKHREITFTVRAENEEKNLIIVKALAANLEKNAGKYIAHSANDDQYSAKIIDLPTAAAFNSGRNLLLSSVRLIVGIIIGVALAFLLAYLDTRLRTPADFKEYLELPVLGEIPGKSLFGGGSGKSSPPGLSPAVAERETARR